MSDGDLRLTERRSSDERLHQLVAELDALREGYGATAAAIEERAPILKALGAEADPSDPVAGARALLREQCALLGEPPLVQSADVALGLTLQGKSMAERWNKLRRNDANCVSEATAKRDRPRALEALARRMLNRGPAAFVSAAPEARSGTETDDASPYTVEETSTWVRFGLNHRLDQYLVRVGLVAHEDGFQVFRTHYQYFADESEGQLSIRPLFGCKRTGEPYDDGGIHFEDVLTTNQLRKGDRIDLVYEVHCESLTGMEPIIQVTATTDGRASSFSVQFAEDDHPDTLWRFADLTYMDSRSTALRSQRSHDMNSGTFAQITHSDVRKGLCYGVAWDWSQGGRQSPILI